MTTKGFPKTGQTQTLEAPVLREIDASGAEVRTQRLAGAAAGFTAALRNGRWTIAEGHPGSEENVVRSYPLDGLTVAPDGWPALRGNMERNHRGR